MPDVFDSIQPQSAPPPKAPDVFDRLPAQTAPANGDVFDRLPASATATPVSASVPATRRDVFSLIPSDAKIEANQPSVWQRIKDVFTAGVPRYSSYTASNPKYGTTQLVSPEAALTPEEQSKHPIATGAGEFAGSLTSPGNVTVIAGTGGLGELPGAAGAAIPRLMSAGFGIQAIKSAYQQYPAIRDAFARGDQATGERLLTKAILSGGIGLIAGAHAATGRPLFGAKTEPAQETPQTPEQIIKAAGLKYRGELTPDSDIHQFEHPQHPGKTAAMRGAEITPESVREKIASKISEFETKPVEPTSIVGENLSEPGAPEIRIADSDAAKAHIENQSTVLPATATNIGPATKQVWYHGGPGVLGDISQGAPGAYGRPGLVGLAHYMTDNPEVAGSPGYGGKPGGAVFAGTVRPDLNILDGEQAAPENIKGIFAKAITGLPGMESLSRPELESEYFKAPGDQSGAANTVDLFAGLKRALAEAEIPKTESLEVFQNIAFALRDDAGYDAIRYNGGRYVGMTDASGKPILHNVLAILPDFKQSSGDIPKGIIAPTVPARTARVVSDDYIPTVSRNEVLAQAIQTMVNNSTELAKLAVDPSQIQTPEDVTALLDRVSDHIKSNLDSRANSVLTFDLQKQLASELGMSVEQLLSNKSGTAFNAERAIAARALLKDSQARVLDLAKQATANSDPAYLKSFTDSLAQHKAILDVVKGQVAREAGRALGSFRILDADLPQARIADALAKLPADAQAKAAQLLSKIDPANKAAVNDFVQKITPASTSDKLFEYYRNALLSSPHTVIVKTASEATSMALEATKKLVASGLSKDRFAAESYWFARGAVQALRNAGPILRGEFQLENAPGFEETGQQAIKGTLGKVIRMPSMILSRQTNLVYAMNYYGELNAQAARQAITEGLSGEQAHARQAYLSENPTAAMTKAANETALHGTFQNELGKFGTSVNRAIKSSPGNVASYLWPFFKTPVNLVKASAEFSPYGLLKGFSKGDINTAASGLVGSSIAAAIAYAALNGRVTGGGPVDFRKEQTLSSAGWQPYSLKIGNKFYSYHRLEPLGLSVGLIADALHSIHAGDPEVVSQSKADSALGHIMRNASSLPFLFEMSAILQAIDDPSGRRVDNFVDRTVASLIPAGIANIAEATDRTVRHPTDLAETLESRTPGETENIPPALDVTGQPLQRPQSALGGANPFPVTTEKNDPAVSELARLGIATAPAPKDVKRPGTSAKVKPEELTPDESTTLQAQDAKQLYQWMQREITTPAWQRKSDNDKRAIIAGKRGDIAMSRYARLMKLRKAAQ